MIKGVRNLLENLKKVTLQDGSKVTLGIDWAKVFVPRKGKGKGKCSSRSQEAATQQPTASGQLSDNTDDDEGGRPK
jgi:hypothetical protein